MLIGDLLTSLNLSITVNAFGNIMMERLPLYVVMKRGS
jgi:hypothetical protein